MNLDDALKPKYHGDAPSGQPIGEELVSKLLANELRIRRANLDSIRRELRVVERDKAKLSESEARLRERHATAYRAVDELEAQIKDRGA